MSRHTIFVMALALLILADVAMGSDAPVPRQPLGSAMIPPPSVNPLPPPSVVPSDRIRLLNRGNQRLHIAYRDGDTEWKQIDVDAGQPLDIACSSCTGAFTVAMHNGKEPKEYKVSGGSVYLLGWSDSLGVWILTTSR